MAYRVPTSAAYFGGDRDRLSPPVTFSRQQMYSPNRNYREDSHYMGHGGFTEMEGMLEKERIKFKEIRDNLENQLDNERKQRIDFENKLLKLKDEYAKKDLIISELEFSKNHVLHENQDLVMENEKLLSELARMEETYSTKIYELQADLDAQTKNHEVTRVQFHTDFQKFKKQGQVYIESLNFQYDRKIKELEQKLKASELSRKDLAFDNKRLNDLLSTSKMNYQEEVRDLTNRMRDEQLKKIAMLTKSFEQRKRTLQQQKQTLNRKCQQFMKLAQDKDREIQAKQTELHSQIQQLRQEIADQINKNTNLGYLCEKLKAQIIERDSVLKKYSGETSQQTGYLKQQFEQKRKENEQLNITIRDLRQQIQDLKADYERKRVELTERINYFESEARKYKDDYTRLHSNLKSKINETINGFSQLHRG